LQNAQTQALVVFTPAKTLLTWRVRGVELGLAYVPALAHGWPTVYRVRVAMRVWLPACGYRNCVLWPRAHAGAGVGAAET
jgi:hypothetical protein